MNNEITLEALANNINSSWNGCRATIGDKSIRLELNSFTGIQISLSYKENIPNFVLSCKTTSWNYDGDRTDLHDVITLAFASFLRINRIGISFHLIYAMNSMGLIESEIDFTHCIGIQYNSKLIGDLNSPQLITIIEELLLSVVIFEEFFWKSVGCFCNDCKKKSNLVEFFNWKAPPEFIAKINRIIPYNETRVNSCYRRHPSWNYYRNFQEGIAVIENPELVGVIKSFLVNRAELKKVNSINGYMFISDSSNNYVNRNTMRLMTKYINNLEPVESAIYWIPLENQVIAFGTNFMIAKNTKSGIEAFRVEKEKLRKRHQIESRLVFPPSTFIWNEKINGKRFESLVKELMEKERGFSNVRKSGLTNEGDNGRDLIAQVSVREYGLVELENLKAKTSLKIVIQCKAHNRSIGKALVKDIRDTIDLHESDGYFLVVSNYITSSLISHLESLKKAYQVDWWTKDEIELRLKQNEEILLRYSDVLMPIVSHH
ncbi:MAG: restriction endonuclease [Flavipsychrobacter sp.]|nr:restriction endonuclease [Flavipsychrobacter sp.]